MATHAIPGQPVRTLSGLNTDVALYPDRVVIRRHDLFSNLLRRDQTIYMGEIAAVHLYECRFEERGQLRFDLVERSHDPIIVNYPCHEHPVALAIKEAVEAALRHI
ncbi:MAG: hypothetical protein HZC41_24550 [Chloroflexi bacterium]|nr:hypothetical protein [Chloroflexota bacterium]